MNEKKVNVEVKGEDTVGEIEGSHYAAEVGEIGIR